MPVMFLKPVSQVADISTTRARVGGGGGVLVAV
uniref:Uncharacterized protein n=1 Tax=Anguilla anguilla TaxID=7936 RepID=A0A0E9VBU5_ANGAN